MFVVYPLISFVCRLIFPHSPPLYIDVNGPLLVCDKEWVFSCIHLPTCKQYAEFETVIFKRSGAMFISIQVGISRLREIKFLRHLNAHGVGLPLIASFHNGIVTKLMPGVPLEMKPEENCMDDPVFAR